MAKRPRSTRIRAMLASASAKAAGSYSLTNLKPKGQYTPKPVSLAPVRSLKVQDEGPARP